MQSLYLDILACFALSPCLPAEPFLDKLILDTLLGIVAIIYPCFVVSVWCWLQWLQWLHWSLVMAARNVVGGEPRLRTTHLVIKCRPVTHRVAALQSIQIFLYKYTNIFMVLNENLSACLELVTALERNFD